MPSFRINSLPVHLAVLAIILNNWNIGQAGLNFSDPILSLALIVLFFHSPRLTIRQFLVFLSIQIIVGMNILVCSLLIPSYEVSQGVVPLAKVFIYTLFALLLFNYIVNRNLVEESLRILTFWAIVTCVIGIYITFVIQSGINFPYKFFWEYTRQDQGSYTSGASADVIRTRSIFSEPQHLGFFLNTVLVFCLFNNRGYTVKKSTLFILTLTAISTYSFSTIPMTIALWGIYVVKRYRINGFMIAVSTTIIFFGAFGTALLSEGLRVTVLQRFNQITAGGDTSANVRIQGSWEYFDPNAILTGNGIGSTPSIWNNYAYVITDLGIIPFLLTVYLSYAILKRNVYFGMYFIFLTFTKGGYLSAYFWTLLVFFFVYSVANDCSVKKMGRSTVRLQTEKELVVN